ncbi:hypothetical protein QBC45DRAFT_479264 [Copromyces sp. CBS 386.78]|nr:hypothetical protein QBC45DRAFT_479264 [Copromyces sp. CBS 386.78]
MSFIPVSPPPTPSGPTSPGILAPSALIAALSSLLSPQTGSLTHLVQSLSVLLSASATGASLSLSFFLVPRLLESPTPLMLTQWRRAYEQTFSTLNRAGAAAALGYFLLAWRFGALKLVKRGRMYAVAGALLVLGMAPYGRQSVRGKSSTKEREKGTDRDGKGKGKEREREKEREVKEEGASREEGDVEAGLGEKVDMKAVEIGAKYWVDQWGVLNLGRAAMIAASAVMGLSASLWN